jgi:aminocarboxymuconate-semialdehyde decarboxylase
VQIKPLGDRRQRISTTFETQPEPAALQLLIDTVGADRIMLGSDMPFPIGDPEPRAILDALSLSEADRTSIESGLALQLMREAA